MFVAAQCDALFVTFGGLGNQTARIELCGSFENLFRVVIHFKRGNLIKQYRHTGTATIQCMDQVSFSL